MMPLSTSQEKFVLFLFITMLMKTFVSTNQSFRSMQTEPRAVVHVCACMHQSEKLDEGNYPTVPGQIHSAAGTTNYGNCFILNKTTSVYLA